MDLFRSLVLDANKSLKLADHMLYVTYPLMRDNKLLIHIVRNIDKSLEKSVDAFLRYELLYKQIRNHPSLFRDKLSLFKKISSRKYNFDDDEIDIISIVRELIKKHNTSPVEFVRGNKLIITDDKFNIETLTFNNVKVIISKAKPFILKLNNILGKDELLRKSKR